MQETTTVLQPGKLLDQVRNKIRFKHYGLSTENTYISWIRQFILHHGKRQPWGFGAHAPGGSKLRTLFSYTAWSER